jgi:DNA-binding NtrC family response regulator
MSVRILIVDDMEDICIMISTALRKVGFETGTHLSPATALAALKTESWDVVISDLRFPGMDGLQFLKEIKAINPDTPVIMLTAHGTVETAIQAMKMGAADFILKPFDLGELKLRLDRVNESLHLRREVSTLRKALSTSGPQMIVKSASMLALLERVNKLAATDASALILGESGTGKECVAQAIFRASPQWNKVFVARNCSAIPEAMFEAEMFGHRKGAYTGADKDRKGAFLEADGGTLFLDEIGDLDYTLQTKLLRAIQERVIRPVGGDRDIPVSFRLICATNKNLIESCKTKEFREDLYYRLATVSLTIPPLRDRRDDILPLARHFVQACSSGTRVLSAKAEEALNQYNWPGNVRQLRSVIEQSVIFARGNEIEADELGITFESSVTQGGMNSLAECERRHIKQILANVDGNKTEAAKQLEVARSTLILKLKQYEIE